MPLSHAWEELSWFFSLTSSGLIRHLWAGGSHLPTVSGTDRASHGRFPLISLTFRMSADDGGQMLPFPRIVSAADLFLIELFLLHNSWSKLPLISSLVNSLRKLGDETGEKKSNQAVESQRREDLTQASADSGTVSLFQSHLLLFGLAWLLLLCIATQSTWLRCGPTEKRQESLARIHVSSSILHHHAYSLTGVIWAF